MDQQEQEARSRHRAPSAAQDPFVRLKLHHRAEEGISISPAALPGLQPGDILQLRAGTHYVYVQYKKEGTKVVAKDSIQVCEKVFDSRKEHFPARSYVEVRRVQKEEVSAPVIFHSSRLRWRWTAWS